MKHFSLFVDRDFFIAFILCEAQTHAMVGRAGSCRRKKFIARLRRSSAVSAIILIHEDGGDFLPASSASTGCSNVSAEAF